MAHDVSVVGLYILDILGRPVSAIPDGGNVEFIEQIRLTVAGTAGGTAVDCAKLGLRTAAVGAVGEDEKADFVLNALRQFGIDTALMQAIPGVPTSATILNIRPNGDRPALHQRGASDYLEISPELRRRVLESRFVHLGGTGLLNRLDGPPTTEFLRAAKEHGCTTTFDLIAATRDTLSIVEPALPYIDYFMPSVEEAFAMSGQDDAAAAASFFLERGAGTCVFTQGCDGAYVATADGGFSVPAFEVDVVDTTGCGDAFSAGFIAALSRGWEPERCARFANAVSGLVATSLGSDAGIVDFDHAVEMMETFTRRSPTHP